MNTYIALFIIATLGSLGFTPVIRRLCARFNLFDVPVDNRRVHTVATPRLGGVAIFAAVALALSALTLVSNLVTQSLQYYAPQIVILLVPSALVLLLGVYDDIRGANAVVKFVGLGLIASLFFAMGGRIEALAIPFVGTIHFTPALSFLITVFWLVGISNAFNLIDGVDGLAAGAALFSSMVILGVALAGHHTLAIVISIVLCGALAGFLRYNFNPASIFLGDSGALSIGFLLAGLSVVSVQKATTAVAVITPLLAFGLPVFDTGITMARRIISGRPIFQGDGEHIHHMLLARGWSQKRVVLMLYAVCAVFGLLATLFTRTSSPVTGFVLFVMAVAVIVAVGHLRYHEMDELRAGVKRTVGDRRVRLANNIRVRRAGVALSKAANLNELFDAMSHMLEFEEFCFANAQLGRVGRAEINELAFHSSDQQRPSQKIEFRNGQVAWSWNQNGVAEKEIIGSSEYWCFRLPLSTRSGDWGWINLYRPLDGVPLLLDMNYLAGFLRNELSQAAERIFLSHEKAASAGMRRSVGAGKIAG